MKRWYQLGLIGLAVFTVAAGLVFSSKDSGFAANEKFSFVDVAKVFDGYEKTKIQDKSLQDIGKKKEEERDAMVLDIRKLKDEIALLGEDAKSKKQESLDDKVRQLQNFDLEVKKEMGEKRNVAVREIFKDIDDVVQRYGERKGLDFILNERALLYKNARFDVTEDILKELNQEYSKKKK